MFLEKKLHSLPRNRLNKLSDEPMTNYLLLLEKKKLHLAWLVTEPYKYRSLYILSQLKGYIFNFHHDFEKAKWFVKSDEAFSAFNKSR
jgi:hypothetical protein